MIKLSMHTDNWRCLSGSLDQAVAAAKKFGLEYIEFGVVDGQDFVQGLGYSPTVSLDANPIRLRTTANGTNGSTVEPKLCTLRTDRAQRVVITYRPGQLNCYVDGKLVTKTDKIQGNFSTWDASQTLMFGDERDTHRYWKGRLKNVKIHSRAMSPDQATRSSSP